MRSLARAVVAATATAGTAAGCFLVTGGTGGYSLAPPEAGICSIDAASLGLGAALPITCACSSSADCPRDGGAQFCCFAVSTSASSVSAGSTCQAKACDPQVGAQLCKKSSECVDAACVIQTCSFSELSIPVQVCGAVDGCAP